MKSDPSIMRTEGYSEAEEFRDDTYSEKKICLRHILFITCYLSLYSAIIVPSNRFSLASCFIVQYMGQDQQMPLIFSCLLFHALYRICFICLTPCLFKEV